MHFAWLAPKIIYAPGSLLIHNCIRLSEFYGWGPTWSSRPFISFLNILAYSQQLPITPPLSPKMDYPNGHTCKRSIKLQHPHRGQPINARPTLPHFFFFFWNPLPLSSLMCCSHHILWRKQERWIKVSGVIKKKKRGAIFPETWKKKC